MAERRISEDLKELVRVLQRNELLVDYFNLSLDLLAIGSTDGYFVVVNESWTRVLGWTAEELTSHPYTYFVHPDDVPATDDATEQLANANDILDFSNRYRKKDGGYVRLSWRVKQMAEKGIVFGSARPVEED